MNDNFDISVNKRDSKRLQYAQCTSIVDEAFRVPHKTQIRIMRGAQKEFSKRAAAHITKQLVNKVHRGICMLLLFK